MVYIQIYTSLKYTKYLQHTVILSKLHLQIPIFLSCNSSIPVFFLIIQHCSLLKPDADTGWEILNNLVKWLCSEKNLADTTFAEYCFDKIPFCTYYMNKVFIGLWILNAQTTKQRVIHMEINRLILTEQVIVQTQVQMTLFDLSKKLKRHKLLQW